MFIISQWHFEYFNSSFFLFNFIVSFLVLNHILESQKVHIYTHKVINKKNLPYDYVNH